MMLSLRQQVFIIIFFLTFDTIVLLKTVQTVSSIVTNPEEAAFIPPCPQGNLAKDNHKSKTVNGCGSLAWQIAAGKVFYPFSRFFIPCCDIHDHCFDTCGAPNYLKFYESCNYELRRCMANECQRVSHVRGIETIQKMIKKRCLRNSQALMTLIDLVGIQAFTRAQKDRCQCQQG